MKAQVIKVDEEGYFDSYEYIELPDLGPSVANEALVNGYITFSWVAQEPKRRWFVPKWDFKLNKWVESKTEEEIKSYDKEIIKESKSKEEELEKQILDLQNLIIEEKYNNLIGGYK